MLALLERGVGRERMALLGVAGRRRIARALTSIRKAALGEAMGDATGADDVTFLAERLLEAASEKEVEAGPRALLDLVNACEDPAERLAALRRCSDRVRNPRFSKEARLAHCREGLAVARSVEEEAVAIQTCRGIPVAETMDLVIPYLRDSALKETACEALVGMSHRMICFQPEAVVRAMRLVLDTTSNEETEKLARQLLRNAGGTP